MKRPNNLLSKRTISVRLHVGDEILLREYSKRHNVAPSTALRYIIHQYFELNEQLADRRREARRYDKLLESLDNFKLPSAEELTAINEPGNPPEWFKRLLQEAASTLTTNITTAFGTELAEKVAERLIERLKTFNETAETKLIQTLTEEFGEPLNRLVEMLFKYFDENSAQTGEAGENTNVFETAS